MTCFFSIYDVYLAWSDLSNDKKSHGGEKRSGWNQHDRINFAKGSWFDIRDFYWNKL